MEPPARLPQDRTRLDEKRFGVGAFDQRLHGLVLGLPAETLGRVKDEWENWKAIARSFGYMFFGMGVILLVLIVYAMATRLTH